MKKLLLLILFIFLIYLFQQHQVYKNNTSTYQIPPEYISTYYDKYINIFCVRPQNYQLPEEFLGSYLIINNAGAANPVQDCINYKYDFLKYEVKGLNGYFQFNEENLQPNNLTITVDNLYKGNSNLTTAVLILHELSNAYETLKARETQKDLSCLHKEILAYSAQVNFINLLSNKDKLTLYLDVLSKSIQDSSYEILRQVIYQELKAELICFYDQNCRKINIMKNIERILRNNAIHQKYCLEY